MAIVKLVCQGCGANLDALDNQRILQCGYCGTSNQIKQTVYEQRPVQPQPAPMHQPPVQTSVPSQQQVNKSARRGVTPLVAITTLLPLVLGGIIAFSVLRTTTDVLNDIPARFGGPTLSADSKYRWDSEMPFVADVDGNGDEDIIGLTQVRGTQDVRLTARSGSAWTTLWEISLGNRADIPGRPRIRFDPTTKLVLFAVGAAMTAYDASTGTQRWVSNFSDAVEDVALDGELLQVWTIDEKVTAISPVDGKPVTDAAKPSESARMLRDDEGYELIPEIGTLDLDYDQFADLRVQAAFCPEQELPTGVDRRRLRGGKLSCEFAHGLAWASRATGTQVPFLLGYDRKTKAERWRVQLTTPGTLETIDTGLNQPRAELFGDSAVVAFVPSDKHARIRRISLLDGSTQWEAKIAPRPGGRITGMIVGKDLVYVNSGDELHVFDLATGDREAVLGDW